MTHTDELLLMVFFAGMSMPISWWLIYRAIKNWPERKS